MAIGAADQGRREGEVYQPAYGGPPPGSSGGEVKPMTNQRPDRSDDLPVDPDPPARATDIDKQEPASPDSSPEPVASEVESARLLANQARPTLGAEGFSDERIDELASAFIAKDMGETVEEFVRWARLEGQTSPDPDAVL
jgi:hypothetical protein